MNDFSLLKAVLVFMSMIVVDIFWGFYIRRIGQGKAMQAASFSLLITIFSAFVVINYVKNWRYLAAAAIGAFVGTWLTVLYDARKNIKPPSK